MRRFLIPGLKIIGGVVAAIVVILLGAALIFNTSSFQNKIMSYSTELLAERLETKVNVDSVSINFLTFDVNLWGVDIEDREQRKMLQTERLSVNLDIWGILSNHIKISSAELDGVKARLYKPEEGEANYQFVLDAFKSDKPKKAKKEDGEKKEKKKLTLDVSKVEVSRIDVVFNEDTFYLGNLDYVKRLTGSQEGSLRDLRGKLDFVTKKGPQTGRVEIGKIALLGKDDRQQVKIDDLYLNLDNHLPRKNEGKPNRGYFDVGHFDIHANMELMVNHLGKDTANVSLVKFEAVDTITGFDVKTLKCRAGINKKAAYLSNITVQQGNTVLNFDSATIQLPSKKEGRKFAFQTSLIKGKAFLQDIARPFAPVLKNFTMPLELSLLFSGTDTTLVFKDVEVHTPDQRLTIHAEGGITHLNVAQELEVRFQVKDMLAKGTVKEEIISMFAGKKLMMKQLKNLGDISYTGDFAVLYKREEFEGTVRTAAGNLDFNFALDENNKYLSGTANTKAIHLGKVLEMKDIGDVALKADFKIDIDKQRTLQMRKKYGGKMPIGNVNAIVHQASYKGVKVKELVADIKSNGGQLEGSISQQNKGLDWACDFSISDIDKMSSLKVKPKVKVKVKDIIDFSKLNPFKKKKK
ncbi:MAG: hypothetical protein IJQ60_03015 [Prevotella sp.]|nr:hypothetical protein [Prevotella sp.]